MARFEEKPRWPVLLALLTLGSSLALSASHVHGEDLGTLTITCLEIKDVNRGAGLAVVIETPGRKTYLYDTGNGYPDGNGWAGAYNAGRDTVRPLLAARGVKAIDGVLISHAHYDHFGGLLWLAGHLPIARLIDAGYHFPGESSTSYSRELADYDALRERFRARPGAYLAAHAGDRLALDDRLVVDVLAPPQTFFTEPHPERRPKADPPAHYLVNANSLGVRIQHGRNVVLLPGDIQREDQERLLLPSVAPEKLRCDVLIAPGHGIHASPAFAAATRPQVTIASAPPRYARVSPTPRVFQAVGSRVYLTGLQGTVTVVSDGVSVVTQAERSETEERPQ